jgi:hypothetical protein
MKTFPLFLLTSVALFSTGCSRSLNGLIYDRGTKAEFNYPSVQYGHVETVTPIDEAGIATGSIAVDEKKIEEANADAPLSSSSLARSRINMSSTEKSAEPSDKTREAARIDQLKRKANVPPLSADQNKIIEITAKIKNLGIYDPKCTDEKVCPLPRAVKEETEKNLPLKVRMKIRLDSGKDYMFNQTVTPNWNPQPADRVKVFFNSADTTSISRALHAEQAVGAEEPHTDTTQPTDSPEPTAASSSEAPSAQ